MERFKSNPYNPSNIFIQESDIINIMNTLNINDFTITDISNYQRAFIHKSYCSMKDYEEYVRPSKCLPLFEMSYETYEFVGDAFLEKTICYYLFERYATHFNQDEGFLTKLKIKLVNGEQLAFLSKQLGFSKFLILSKHVEENCSGRENVHNLEDILEAFIAAIYMDTKSHDLVTLFITNLIETHIDFCDLIMKDTNYKDQILRYFQHNYKLYPKYTHIQDDSKLFTCKLLKENDVIACGRGDTKKKAEQNASKNALIKYHVI